VCYDDVVVNRVRDISCRVIRKEVKVDASIEKAWKAWTTNDGAATFFAPKAKIQLTLIHLGWREGEEWEKVFQYFLRAWDIVLGRLERVFLTREPINWRTRTVLLRTKPTQYNSIRHIVFSAPNAHT